MAPRHTILIRTLLGATVLAMAGSATAQDAAPSTRTIVIKDVPAPLADIYRVSSSYTPSGYDVPRFVSLKFGKVNARTGPSRAHPIAYQYQRRGLPLVVVAETEMWRKVRDIHGDEAWVRKPALSGDRSAIATRDTTMLARADSSSKPVARVERGALLRLEECGEAGFCRVETESGLKGWTLRSELWGAQSVE